MTDDNSNRRLTRRNALRIAGAAGAASLAGCGGSDGGDGSSGDGSSGDGGDTSTDSGTQYSTLEVAHWWGEGDGLEAIQAVMDAFKEQNPDVPFDENLIAGGAGENLQANIRTRVQNGNHPSTWQAWPGNNLLPFTDANLLEDIGDSVWSENSMEDAYLQGVKDAAQPAGNYVTVPLNIHRLNNLFYNVSVLEDAGVDPTTIDGPQGLLEAMETVAAETDATPMAHQTQAPWSSLQLWESIFIGQQNVEEYQTLLGGDVASMEDAVRSALDTLASYADHYPEDAGSISWDQGNNDVIEGNAAFLHQGDNVPFRQHQNIMVHMHDPRLCTLACTFCRQSNL